MNEKDKKLEKKRILIYLGITFFITYVYSFCVVYPLSNTDNVRSGMSTLTTLLIAAIMFFPAIGVFLTRLITKEGFKNSFMKPNFKGNIKTYLLAYFGPGILSLLGTVLYFLIFPNQFDPELGFVMSSIEATGTSLGDITPQMLVLSQIFTGFLFGPILNFLTCFGEEWGWRGYLLPKMADKLPMIPMLLINGVIWGLWHAPLTAIGHNYGVGYPLFPFTGIAAMCFFCIVMGIFLSYVTMKTKSCIPAILGHGAINSQAAMGMYFTVDGGNPFVGPAPTGFVGAIPFIVVAILMLVFYFGKIENRNEM